MAFQDTLNPKEIENFGLISFLWIWLVIYVVPDSYT